MGYKKQVNIGQDTTINADLILQVSPSDTAAAKKLIQRAQQDAPTDKKTNQNAQQDALIISQPQQPSLLIDVTGKKERRSVILVDARILTVYISNVAPETLRKRWYESLGEKETVVNPSPPAAKPTGNIE